MPGLADDTRGILEPHAVRGRFTLDRRPPSPDLEPWVELHWIVAWDLRGRPPFVQEVLPHPCVNLVFEPGAALVHGVKTRLDAHRLEGLGCAVGTKFRPGGFSGLVDRPVAELTDRTLPLPEAFGAEAARELAPAVDAPPDARIAVVEVFLRRRLRTPDPDAVLAGEVVAALLAAGPDARVAAVAAAHGLSPRTLQRLFRRHVGVSPKAVLTRHRQQAAAERVATGEPPAWAELAQELGYADQAHLTRDFRSATGRPPGRYAAAAAPPR
jgi:AraC-like DNA-binding protein